MRKRIGIGLLLVVVIAVIVYVRSRPDTVEYHEREYVNAWEGGAASRWILDKGPDWMGCRYMKRRSERLDEHRAALVRHGFLIEQIFVVSNCTSSAMWRRLEMAKGEALYYVPEFKYAGFRAVSTNSVAVVAVSNLITRYPDIIRRLDVP